MTDPVDGGTLITPRLRLVVAPPDVLDWLVARDEARAAALLDADAPTGWVDADDARSGLAFHAQSIRRDPAQRAWRVRLVISTQDRRLIGSINLKGLPDAEGAVEIGWGIDPAYRGRGLATEAAARVLSWVDAQPAAMRVIATIPDDRVPSQRVATRLGFASTAEHRRGMRVWSRSIAR